LRCSRLGIEQQIRLSQEVCTCWESVYKQVCVNEEKVE
jgi:hypothetical protein